MVNRKDHKHGQPDTSDGLLRRTVWVVILRNSLEKGWHFQNILGDRWWLDEPSVYCPLSQRFKHFSLSSHLNHNHSCQYFYDADWGFGHYSITWSMTRWILAWSHDLTNPQLTCKVSRWYTWHQWFLKKKIRFYDMKINMIKIMARDLPINFSFSKKNT